MAEGGVLEQFNNCLVHLQQLQEKAENVQKISNQIADLQHTIGYLEQELSAERFFPFQSLSDSQRDQLDMLLRPQTQHLLQRCQQLIHQEEQLNHEMNDEKLSLFQNAPEDFSSTLTQLFQQKEALEILNEVDLSADNLTPDGNPNPGILAAGFSFVFALLGFLIGFYLSPWIPMEPLQGGLIFFALFGCLVAAIVFIGRLLKKKRDRTIKNLLQTQQATQAEALRLSIARLQSHIQPFLGNISNAQNLRLIHERWEYYQKKRTQLQNLHSERQAIEKLEIINLASDHPLIPLLKSTSAETLRERLGQWSEKKNRLHTLLDTVKNIEPLVSSTSNSALQSQIGETLARIAYYESQDPPLQELRNHPELILQRINNLRQRAAELQEQIDSITGEEHATQIRIAQLMVNRPRHPENIEEDILFSDKQVKRFEERRAALKLAFDALQQATSEYQNDHLERLTQRTGQYFNEFTAGKYRGVIIQKGYAPAVLYQSREPIAPARLSAGAGDQLYFALRLAIADLLTSDSPLPLILDDTFINFDSNRLAIVQKILYQIAPQRQIFLFSHQDTYHTWQGNIISLDSLQR